MNTEISEIRQNILQKMVPLKTFWSFVVLLYTYQICRLTNGYIREACTNRKSKLGSSNKILQTFSQHHQRLRAVREQMQMRVSLQGPEIDAYILSSYDEHLNAVVSLFDQRLQYLTGFTGTNAWAIITQKNCSLWVENRFLRQADDELDCEWELYNINGKTTISDWLITQLRAEQRIGADPHIVPHHLWLKWSEELSQKLLKLIKINNNLIDLIRGADFLQSYNATVQIWEKIYAGQRWEDKIRALREKLYYYHKCDAMIVTSLTEIAYLLNIRGRDIPFTPVVKDVFLYVDHLKISLSVEFHLHTDCFNEMCVKIKQYHQIWNDIRTYSQTWKRVLIPAPCVQELGVSEAIFSSLPLHIIYEHVSPVILMRAAKNSVEQKGMRLAHIRDGAAICEAISNLEKRFYIEQWTEEKIKYEVERSRLSQIHAKGLSRPTVVSFGIHSSYPYYTSSNITDIAVTNESLLIIESGCQYYEGTTDVSRTFIFGEPILDMKQAYTSALGGLLRLANLKFPSDLRPAEIDVLVRSPIWNSMKDYPQVNGYVIGSYNSVKEPPISMSYKQKNNFLFKDGYFFSIESGYYKTEKFGMQLKNVLEVRDTQRVHPSGTKFLSFNDVTLVPYEPKLIDHTLLSSLEKRWLNEYNAKIRQLVGGELKRQGNMQAFYWMMNKTRYIHEYLPEGEYTSLAIGNSTCINQFICIIGLSVTLILIFINACVGQLM